MEQATTATLDNASNNRTTIDLIKLQMPLANLIEGSVFQNRCICHILSLIAQVYLKHILVATEKTKSIAKYIFSFAQRRQLYSTICVRHNVSSIKIILDVNIDEIQCMIC